MLLYLRLKIFFKGKGFNRFTEGAVDSVCSRLFALDRFVPIEAHFGKDFKRGAAPAGG